MRRWHVRVTPVPDEAQVVEVGQVQAALAYLQERVADGRYARCLAFRRTGGYIELDAHDPHEIEAALGDYPLRSTITVEIDELVTLEEGFGVLLDNVAARPGTLTA